MAGPFALLALLALLPAAVEPQAMIHEEKSALLDFSYGWAPVVEQLPALRAALEEERRDALANARARAEEDRASRDGDFPFHSFSKIWQVTGRAAPLLALTAYEETYTGGAHGGLGLYAILWDSAADREVDIHDILGPDVMASIRPRFCAALDAMRAERRGEPVRPNDMFGECPDLADRAITPIDLDGDHRFGMLRVLIPPYVAGPWVEGPYEVELALTAADLRDLPEAYRESFEPAEFAPAE